MQQKNKNVCLPSSSSDCLILMNSVEWHALQVFVFVLILLLNKASEKWKDLGHLAASNLIYW